MSQMTEEEKQAAEAAAAAKAKAEEEARKNETSEQKAIRESKEREESLKKDYEAKLTKEREAREKAEKAAADAAFKAREAKRNQGGDDEDKPLTSKELEIILARERQLTSTGLAAAENERIANELARVPEEAALTLEVLKNTVFPTHYSQREKVEAAWAIANRTKLIGEHKEALRALKSRENIERGGDSGHHDTFLGNEPKLSPVDEAAIKAVGFTWNATSRQYEKRLKNGQLLVKDPKTKQTRLVKA